MNHAFLIQAHNQPQLLKLIVDLLDAPNHFFFIHIDLKQKNNMYKTEEIKQLHEKNNVFIYSFLKVNWGDENQFFVSLKLLNIALNKEFKCNYFHLISGVDLPIKSNKEFDSYFLNDNLSYLGFVDPKDAEICKERIDIYYLRRFINYRGNFYLKILNDLLENLQFFIIKKGIKIRPELKYKIYKGSQWWSLNSKVASYVVDFCKENQHFLKRFKYTNCCDEMFFHIIIMNSKYKDYIVHNNLRYIDWNCKYPDESLPRILKEEDWESMKNSNALLCRKIDWNLSKSLIECIKKELLQ